MGTERLKDGASSKASSAFSDWRKTMWFLKILDSRSLARKISSLVRSDDFQLRPLASVPVECGFLSKREDACLMPLQ